MLNRSEAVDVGITPTYSTTWDGTILYRVEIEWWYSYSSTPLAVT